MEPSVRYIRDLPIPEYWEWRDAQSHNWLHPSHGRLPEMHGMMSCKGGTFIGAAWDQFDYLDIFLFLQDDNESSVAYREVGNIPRTYRWFVEEDRMFCMDRIVPTPKNKKGYTWETKLLRTALIESVKVAFTFTLGNKLKNRHLFVAHAPGRQHPQEG